MEVIQHRQEREVYWSASNAGSMPLLIEYKVDCSSCSPPYSLMA